MIPSSFVTLPKLPLTLNGKVDYKKLPKPFPAVHSSFQSGVTVLSSGNLERRIADIWQRVLGRSVGMDDNFFEAGGNSLLLMRVVADLRADVNSSLTTVDMFAHPTIRSMIRYVSPLSDDERKPDGRDVAGQMRRRNVVLGELRQKRAGITGRPPSPEPSPPAADS
jgi:hypothetical protein